MNIYWLQIPFLMLARFLFQICAFCATGLNFSVQSGI